LEREPRDKGKEEQCGGRSAPTGAATGGRNPGDGTENFTHIVYAEGAIVGGIEEKKRRVRKNKRSPREKKTLTPGGREKLIEKKEKNGVTLQAQSLGESAVEKRYALAKPPGREKTSKLGENTGADLQKEGTSTEREIYDVGCVENEPNL